MYPLDDFKPASIDTSCEGELQVGKGDEVTITLPHIPVSFPYLTLQICFLCQGSYKLCSELFILYVAKGNMIYFIKRICGNSDLLKKTPFLTTVCWICCAYFEKDCKEILWPDYKYNFLLYHWNKHFWFPGKLEERCCCISLMHLYIGLTVLFSGLCGIYIKISACACEICNTLMFQSMHTCDNQPETNMSESFLVSGNFLYRYYI